MNNSACGIRRAATNAMLSWVRGNSDTDQLMSALQAYFDRRVGSPTTETNDNDRQRHILIRWTVACAIMAPVLPKIPHDKVRPLFDAVKQVAYGEWDNQL